MLERIAKQCALGQALEVTRKLQSPEPSLADISADT